MLASLGLSFKTASAEIRGKFAFTNQDINDFGKELIGNTGIKGIVIISTCNRSEFYFEYNNIDSIESIELVLTRLINFKNVDSSYQKYFYTRDEKETVHHLFSVVCGFDSMSLGEYQIVTQVKDAYKEAEKFSLASKELKRLFQKSFETGKKIRTSTEINRGASSISYAAIELMQTFYSNFEDKNILVIGLGQTGEAITEYLTKFDVKQLFISNRTHFKAQNLASHFNAIPVKLNELDSVSSEVDIVFVATSSPTPIITKEDMSKTYGNKILIDLSIPRNIALDVEDLDNCKVFDVDDLQKIVSINNNKREGEVQKGIRIMEGLEQDFLNWLSSQKLISTINIIQKNFQEVNIKELEGFKKINREEREILDLYGEHISNKYIRLLIKNIKNVSDNGNNKEFIDAFNKVFQLQEN